MIIQRLIDSGRTIKLDSGHRYEITEPLIPKDGMVLIGNGATIVQTDPSKDIFQWRGPAQNVRIYGPLTLTHGSEVSEYVEGADEWQGVGLAMHRDSDAGPGSVNKADGLQLVNVTLTGISKQALMATRGTVSHGLIDNCDVSYTGRGGLIFGSAEKTVIRNCRLAYTGDDGIAVNDYSKLCEVTGNSLSHIGVTGGDDGRGILVCGFANSVRNNSIRWTRNVGIVVTANISRRYFPDHNELVGNIISGFHVPDGDRDRVRYSIEVDTALGPTFLRGNKCSGQGDNGKTYGGLIVRLTKPPTDHPIENYEPIVESENDLFTSSTGHYINGSCRRLRMSGATFRTRRVLHVGRGASIGEFEMHNSDARCWDTTFTSTPDSSMGVWRLQDSDFRTSAACHMDLRGAGDDLHINRALLNGVPLGDHCFESEFING